MFQHSTEYMLDESTDVEIFKKLTGHDRLLEILEGIKILQKLNFKNIKVNAVLLKGVNDTYEEFEKFGNLTHDVIDPLRLEFDVNESEDINFIVGDNCR